MVHYEARNQEEYMDALMEIINVHKRGVILMKRDNIRTSVYFHSVLDLPNDIKVIYSNYRYDTGEYYLKEPVDLFYKNLKELSYSGIYANNKLYLTGHRLGPSFVDDYDFQPVAIEVAHKVAKYITDKIVSAYPTLESIPEECRKFNDVLIKREARVRWISNLGEIPAWTVKYDDVYLEYDRIQTVIDYERAADKDEFIRNRAETILNNPCGNYPTVKDCFIHRLAEYYVINDYIRENGINEEDKLFVTIRKALRDFHSKRENVKNIRVFLNGRNDMLVRNISVRYPNFTIENKEIEIVSNIGTFTGEYIATSHFSAYEASCVSPKLQDIWTDNYEKHYLASFLPSDIRKITSGKTVIYER